MQTQHAAGVAAMTHIGYLQLHPDASLNFQMNRWIQWLGDDRAIHDMQTVAPRIHDYTDWKQEFLCLAAKALAEGHLLHGAIYFRSAEFFMAPDDPERQPTREQFLMLIRHAYAIQDVDRHAVAYRSSTLPVYRLTPSQPRGTIVIFGGFDSYIEEFFPIAFALYEAHYDVVLFEGPGQGGALEDSGLTMTYCWERPVSAVLDAFALADVTLLGISLGGGLAIRAAAFEPRIQRVIAYDVLFDLLDCNFRQLHPLLKVPIRLLLALQMGRPLDALIQRTALRRPVIAWALRQGMHIFGATTPAAYLRMARNYTTRAISASVSADVLLLAGSEDHYVPLRQFYEQASALKRARSLTGRIFTRQEHAQNHCQIGNIGLALQVILHWLDGLDQRTSTPSHTGKEQRYEAQPT